MTTPADMGADAMSQDKPPLERMGLDAIRQAIEERDAMEHAYHLLAGEMVYEGNSVQHWRSKARAYGDAVTGVWNELKAAGIVCDGRKSCTEGVRELAARVAELEADARALSDAVAEIDRLNRLLTSIGDYAHDHSTGPAVPDALWEIRRMAYEGESTGAAIDAAMKETK